jgi:hypothetical protein
MENSKNGVHATRVEVRRLDLDAIDDQDIGVSR